MSTALLFEHHEVHEVDWPGRFAGVMGMNFRLGIFATTAYFWVVVVPMLVVAIVTLAIARMRDWV